MKKRCLAVLVVLGMSMTLLVGCSETDSEIATNEVSSESEMEQEASDKLETTDIESSSEKKANESSSKPKETSTSFTNAYGTASTKCAHPGCNNTIASSGDTNCCTVHSNRCLECGKYIDEDAMYCLSCLADAAESNDNEDYSSSYDDSDVGYSYDSSDPYYSSNDHDGDGKISDEEFQDAINDYMDDLLEDNGGY